MKPHISVVTLGVSDLNQVTPFYEGVPELPRIQSLPAIAFFELGRTLAALFPRRDLAADRGLQCCSIAK